jgi:hypothetical protein
MAATMLLDAMCVDLAAPLDGKRYSMLDLPVSYTKEDLTAVLQKACDREDDAYFQIKDIMQEGVKLGTDQRVDYYGIRGGSLIWSFNVPIKVRAQVTAPDEEPVEHDLWLRQIERGGASTVEVDPNDTDGIMWLNDNGCTQSTYTLLHEGCPLSCSKLRHLAYTSRTRIAIVTIRNSSSIQVLVRGLAGSVRAVTVLSGDTIKTLRNKYNLSTGKNLALSTCRLLQLYQKLNFGDKQLHDNSVLFNLGITDGTVLKKSYGGLLGGAVNRAIEFNLSTQATFADVSEPGITRQ